MYYLINNTSDMTFAEQIATTDTFCWLSQAKQQAEGSSCSHVVLFLGDVQRDVRAAVLLFLCIHLCLLLLLLLLHLLRSISSRLLLLHLFLLGVGALQVQERLGGRRDGGGSRGLCQLGALRREVERAAGGALCRSAAAHCGHGWLRGLCDEEESASEDS